MRTAFPELRGKSDIMKKLGKVIPFNTITRAVLREQQKRSEQRRQGWFKRIRIIAYTLLVVFALAVSVFLQNLLTRINHWKF